MARYYGYVGAYSPAHAVAALVGTVIWLSLLLAFGWYVVHHWPEVQDFLQHFVHGCSRCSAISPPMP